MMEDGLSYKKIRIIKRKHKYLDQIKIKDLEEKTSRHAYDPQINKGSVDAYIYNDKIDIYSSQNITDRAELSTYIELLLNNRQGFKSEWR